MKFENKVDLGLNLRLNRKFGKERYSETERQRGFFIAPFLKPIGYNKFGSIY